MKHLRLFGLMVIAVLALGATTAASAWAIEDPEILPNPTEKAPLHVTSEGKASFIHILETSTSKRKIECTEVTNSLEFTSARLGKGEIDFHNCKSSGSKCLTLGDKELLILIPVDVHLVDVLLPEITKGLDLLSLGIWIKPLEEVHIECGVILILVKGSVIGEFLNLKAELIEKVTLLLALFEEAEISFEQKEGKQSFTKCDLDKTFCEGHEFKLEANFGKGPEPAGELSADIVKAEKGTKIHIDF
jgi:hypothetical protein